MTVIVDRDRGWNRLMRELRARPRDVIVGVFGDDAAEPHPDSPMLTIAEVLSHHEFGIGNAPQRSWLRDWFDENKSEIEAAHRKLMLQVVDGNLTLDMAAERLGLMMVRSLKDRWIDGIPPELDPRTIDAKGSSTPLIDSGQSLSSVGHEVQKR